jgi:hypothetical protein
VHQCALAHGWRDNAYDLMQKSDVKYRFVVDNATLAA